MHQVYFNANLTEILIMTKKYIHLNQLINNNNNNNNKAQKWIISQNCEILKGLMR